MADVGELPMDELARLHVLRGPQLMWLLGAGSSAGAGVATAGQMMEEFRALIYSTKQQVPLVALNLAEPAIRDRIDRFFAETPGYPSPGDPGEYSALFEAAWSNPADRRRYIENKIALGKPVFGNLGLAALIALGRAQIIWTTNFDRVVERAAELMLEPPAHLTVATLDTTQIAVDAMASDRFPLYVKLHGDFQSDRLKNTRDELRDQDHRHRIALLQAAQRYGLLVAGYSGRDESLMTTLRDALQHGPEPFPAGLFWCLPPGEEPAPAVTELLAAASQRGVDARFVPVHTFDELIGRLLLTCSLPAPQQEVLDRSRPPRRREPFGVPSRRGNWPIVRLNAVRLTEFPTLCRQVDCEIDGTAAVRDALAAVGARAIGARRSNGVIAFGHDHDIKSGLSPFGIRGWAVGSIDTDRLRRDGSSDLGLLYEAVAGAFARSRPLVAVRTGRSPVLAVDQANEGDALLEPLARALRALARNRNGTPGGKSLTGTVGSDGPTWAEAVRLHLSYHYDALWLVFEPIVWVAKTELATVDARTKFTEPRTWHRYNPVANQLFDAWSKVLHGHDGTCSLYGIDDSDGVDAAFRIEARTAFSRHRGAVT